jgi:hypothetical protein
MREYKKIRGELHMRKITFDKQHLTAVHTSLEIVEDMARVSKIEKLDEDDTNTYVAVDELEFHNGIIEVDVCGKLRSDAPAHARGFIGIVFRVNEAGNEFESFYIRPTNGRDCDDPVRKQHACQYFSYPGYTFSYFREFGIAKYENAIPTIALNEWSHIRAEINGETARFYVNGALVLSVDDLKHGDSKGRIGLYVDIGTDGFFKNLSVECKD